MYTVYHLEADDLNSDFLEALKMLFKGKSLEIVVSEFDETDYLLRSEKNRDRLLRSIAHVNSNVNLIEVEI